jgi:hypothetical protein
LKPVSKQCHPYREQHSRLGTFWHTEMGPLNQVIHVWPYEDLRHRAAAREAANKDANLQRTPGGLEFIVAQESEIMIPAPFMRPLGSHSYGTGNVYEMRIYTYQAGSLPEVLRRWADAIPYRERYSPWRPAGPASWVGSTSSSMSGFIRTRANATASGLKPCRIPIGRRRPGNG